MSTGVFFVGAPRLRFWPSGIDFAAILQILQPQEWLNYLDKTFLRLINVLYILQNVFFKDVKKFDSCFLVGTVKFFFRDCG